MSNDDFVINFATANPVAIQRGPKQKGGRWTDRVKDKRRQEGAVRKATRGPNENKGANVQLGKRERDGEDAGEQQQAKKVDVRPKGGVTVPSGGEATAGSSSAGAGGMIQPRRGLLSKNPGGARAAGGEGGAGGPPSKMTVGPGGKKQYISSLFTAEGLPVTSTTSSAPVIPSRPSNAPMRAPSPIAVDEDEMMDNVDADAAPAPVPDPAPALTALGLMPELVNHLATKLKITGPTACQAGAIPPLILGNSPPPPPSSHPSLRALDAILQSQTGSGKTLSFLLPLLQDLLTLPATMFPPSQTPPTRSIGTLALILAPTRELASQIYSVLESVLSLPSNYDSFTVQPRSLTPCLLVGGANRTHEKRRLRKGCPIVVATPGRLLDHLKTTESFKIAGEPEKTRGPRGKLNANNQPLGMRPGFGVKRLGLRWLVVDECDRLMDLGFEEQMRGVMEEVERRSPVGETRGEQRHRRTVLCSATASEGVERLSELMVKDPVTLMAKTGVVEPKRRELAGVAKGELEDGEEEDGDDDENGADATTEQDEKPIGDDKAVSFTPPTQLVHNYIVCPPKLRFVGLVALIRRLLVNNKTKPVGSPNGSKILIFVSCTAAVDFYWQALGAMGMGNVVEEKPVSNKPESAREKAEREKKEEHEKRTKLASISSLLPGVPIYRLHGNLELQTRLGSLGAFKGKSVVASGKNKGQETDNAVLICTSVAARGLDVRNVSHVVQLDLPTEGGVTEYIHRVGRTARAGASGQATSFLLPAEKEWVPWVETGMRDGVEKREAKDVKLREVGIEDVLRGGFGGEGREFETRATDVQMGFERWVAEEEEHSTLARNAFASHIRAYATHPAAEKTMFNTKALHLGHLAKSFGMREAPGAHNSGKSKAKKGSLGRVSVQRPIGRQISAREQAERAIAGLPSKTSANKDGGFETGRRHDEERAMKRQKEKMMLGPTAESGSEFQVASKEMLESLARGTGVGGKKRR